MGGLTESFKWKEVKNEVTFGRFRQNDFKFKYVLQERILGTQRGNGSPVEFIVRQYVFGSLSSGTEEEIGIPVKR